MRAATIIVILVLVPIPDAVAQGPDALRPGQQVRIRYRCEPIVDESTGQPSLANRQTKTGTIVALPSDAIVLSAAGSTLALPLPQIDRIQVHRGRETHAWLGAKLGFAAGALTGALAGYARCRGNAWLEDDIVGCVLIGAGMGGGVGAGLGALTGSFISTDVWEGLPVERVRVSLVPRWRGLRLRVNLTF